MARYCYIKLLFIVMLSTGFVPGYGQTLSLNENGRRLDSAEQEMKTHFCSGGLTYPATYVKKDVLHDGSVINLINKVFQDDFSVVSIYSDLKNSTGVRVAKEEKRNGLIKVIHIIINGNYIRAELTIEAVDSLIFRKKSRIEYQYPRTMHRIWIQSV